MVTIAGFAFEPGTIEVAVGTTVRWTNDDVCAFHPGSMTGTVVVR